MYYLIIGVAKGTLRSLSRKLLLVCKETLNVVCNTLFVVLRLLDLFPILLPCSLRVRTRTAQRL